MSLRNLGICATVGAAVVGGFHLVAPPNWPFHALAWLGVEVPGLGVPLSSIPNQVRVDGTPQVLIYGPPYCPPAAAIMAALDQAGVPYQFRDASPQGTISQEELGAVLMASHAPLSETTALVLVNGKVLANPTPQAIRREYARAIAP